jgi:hypothetical protein
MRNMLLLFAVSAGTFSSHCLADDACPRTIVSAAGGSSSTASPGAPLADSDQWYGSQAFAVHLPGDGVWSTTAPGALIAVKLIWRGVGFRPGMESNLDVSVKPLNGAPATAVVLGTTNARVESLGGWTMLTGIDFPTAGCWEITGRYLGQELRFVVETVEGASR